MAKLQDDPKVQALIEKSVAAAVKAENKRVVQIVKDEVDVLVAASEDKAVVKELKAVKSKIVASAKA